MAIEWKKDEIKNKLNRFMDSIVKLAMEDDVISQDEQNIIDTMREHILTFEDQLGQMIEMHSSPEDVIDQAKNYFERALEATARQARKDGTITPDELILIDRMAKTLRREDLTKYFD